MKHEKLIEYVADSKIERAMNSKIRYHKFEGSSKMTEYIIKEEEKNRRDNITQRRQVVKTFIIKYGSDLREVARVHIQYTVTVGMDQIFSCYLSIQLDIR